MADIEEFARLIAENGNPERAATWRDGVFNAVSDLASAPESGLPLPEARRFSRLYRQIHYHSYRIVYFVDEAAQTLVVVRVYHGARRALRKDDV